MTGANPRPRPEINDEQFRRGLPRKFLKATLAHRTETEQMLRHKRVHRRKQSCAIGLVGGILAALLAWAALNVHMTATAAAVTAGVGWAGAFCISQWRLGHLLALIVYGLPLAVIIYLSGALTAQLLVSWPFAIVCPFLFATGSFLSMWCGTLD